MKFYFKLSEFYSFEEHDKDPRVPRVFPKLYEETNKISDDFYNNEASDWWILERRGIYNDMADEFENREKALEVLKENLNEAIADYLYF